jgi:predicted nucleic acid-binding protein
MTVVVADSGPLIALAKIEALHLLCDLYQQVITGPTVYTEAVTAGLAMNAADAIGLQEAFQRGELTVRIPSAISLSHREWLHEGEAESIRLAIEFEADWILVDDFSARQIAQQNLRVANLSTGVKGTLGVIVTAAHNHVIAPAQAIELVQGLKGRPDVWLAPALCEATVKALQRLS